MLKVLKYLFSSRSIPIIICTSLMLFFLGIYFLVAFKSGSLVKTLKDESVILVELKGDLLDEDVSALKSRISGKTGVINSSIQFVSKEEAYLLMEEELGAAIVEIAGDNPFFDVYRYSLDNTKADLESHLEDLQNEALIHNAYAQNSYVEEISTNVKRFSIWALLVGIFFSGLALTLIFNAIKLNLVESKSSFYTLKLLGSDWQFIKRPFLQRAFYSGVTSGIIAVILFLITVSYFRLSNEIFAKLISTGNIIFIGLCMAIVGLLVNLFSTNTILDRYLNMSEEDLYK